MLNIRKFLTAIGIVPVSSSGITAKGEIEVLSSNGKINYHDGTVASPLVTEVGTATLTNKSLISPAITTPTGLVKADVGLSNVDNTSDASKPVSSATTTALALKAPLASPVLTGTPTAPTATALTSSTQISTTAYTDAAVSTLSGTTTSALALKAPLASPALTGTPTAPTATQGDNSTKISTTSYVDTLGATKQAASTELSAISALATNGLIAKTGSGTASTVTVTGTTSQIAVTNGDGVAGNPTLAIASNPVIPGTDALTLPQGTTAQRGTGTAGKIRYNIDTGTFEGYASGVWAGIAGAGGGLNYVTSSDGSTTNGWATYANTAGVAPINGTGGSPTVTFASSSVTPLVGATSFLLTKGASNLQGNGVSYDFTIDSAYQAKAMTLSFLYSVASGTYASGDVTMWLYDKTNSVLIQPSASTLNNVLGAAQQKCEFQTNSNSTSYRLIFHVSSTSALAYSLLLDSVSVSPNTYSTGANVDFYGTQSSQAVTANVTDIAFTATKDSNGAWNGTQYVVAVPGDYMVFESLNIGTGGVTPALYKNGSAYGNFSTNGSGGFSSGALMVPNCKAGDTLSLRSNSTQTVTSGQFTVIKVGNTTPQSDTATNVVDFAATGTGGAVTANVTNIPTSTTLKDSNGAWTGSTYVVPVPGDYVCGIAGLAGAGWTSYVYVNGVSYQPLASMNTSLVRTSILIPSLKAGDIISFRSDASVTLSIFNVNIFRLSGPAQIAASEKVFLQYTGNAGTVLTANVTNIDFATKVVDSHGAWNGTTFTAPRPGMYDIKGSIYFTAVYGNILYAFINGVSNINLISNNACSVKNIVGEVYLLAGQTLTFRAAAAATLVNDNAICWISITSQG